jgi:hypothetical protein
MRKFVPFLAFILLASAAFAANLPIVNADFSVVLSG